jgi:hypothetical protein
LQEGEIPSNIAGSRNKILNEKRETYDSILQEAEIRYYCSQKIWRTIFQLKYPAITFDLMMLSYKLHHLFYFFKTHFIISARGISRLNIFVKKEYLIQLYQLQQAWA